MMLTSRGFLNKLNGYFQSIRQQSTLVLVEHSNKLITPITLNTVTAATKLGGDITCLLAGHECGHIAKEVGRIAGVSRILVADSPALKGFLPESITPIVLAAQKQFNFSHIIAGASAYGKSVIPRVAAKLDVSPISDITRIESADTFVRTIYAGNAIQTVKSEDSVRCLTIRGTSFEPACVEGGNAVEEAAPSLQSAQQSLSQFVGQELSKSDRPELAGASIVISGGELVEFTNFRRLYSIFKFLMAKTYLSVLLLKCFSIFVASYLL